MLILSQEHEDEIRRHGERDYPYECCGLLLGRFDDAGRKIVAETYAISNSREEEAKRNRFLIRPEEFMAGDRYARSRGLEIVGVYHSHPDSPAVPSQYDLDHALPVYSYIIVSVRSAQAGDFFSWEMEADRSKFNEEEISISDER